MGDMLKGNMEAAVNANNTMQNSAMNMQGGTMGSTGDSRIRRVLRWCAVNVTAHCHRGLSSV